MATQKTVTQAVAIKPANMQVIRVKIIGTAPYVQAKFSQKAKQMMLEKMAGGSTAKKGKNRAARDYDADYRGAMHLDAQGRHGIPASAFRNAMISACRTVGFKMTLAKLSVFVIADSFDAEDGSPLVTLSGEPEMNTAHARNATGVCDIRVRPMWREWSAVVTIRFDGDQFTVSDVMNLMDRVGSQVGIGEERPDSRESAGCGWGTFRLGAEGE